MRGSFRVWLDAKQARNNDAVPAVLRTAHARRLVRRADLAMAATGAAALALCLLLGVGVGTAWPYVVGLSLLVAGLGAGLLALSRLAKLEHDAGNP